MGSSALPTLLRKLGTLSCGVAFANPVRAGFGVATGNVAAFAPLLDKLTGGLAVGVGELVPVKSFIVGAGGA